MLHKQSTLVQDWVGDARKLDAEKESACYNLQKEDVATTV